mgnify:CR=1 FL=1
MVAAPEVCREIASTGSALRCHAATGADDPSLRRHLDAAHVLYAPLGYSDLSRANVRQATLLVDFLHRDIANGLPDAEVANRERWVVETLVQSDLLQCNSRFVVDRLRHHYGDVTTPTVVVYNAVGLERPVRDGVAPEPPYFFYPANDWPHKNHDRLLQAYARYRAREPEPWRLKLSGHFAAEDSIRGRISELRIDTWVDVLGHLPAGGFARVFSHAGALFFPSRYEGFGIPVLEAFRLGVPVACSRAASLPEVGGEACDYFDPADIDSIAQAMQRLATDFARRRELIAAGIEQAKRFDLSRESGKLAEAFFALGRS